jgi:hypothetical protein
MSTAVYLSTTVTPLDLIRLYYFVLFLVGLPTWNCLLFCFYASTRGSRVNIIDETLLKDNRIVFASHENKLPSMESNVWHEGFIRLPCPPVAA